MRQQLQIALALIGLLVSAACLIALLVEGAAAQSIRPGLYRVVNQSCEFTRVDWDGRGLASGTEAYTFGYAETVTINDSIRSALVQRHGDWTFTTTANKAAVCFTPRDGLPHDYEVAYGYSFQPNATGSMIFGVQKVAGPDTVPDGGDADDFERPVQYTRATSGAADFVNSEMYQTLQPDDCLGIVAMDSSGFSPTLTSFSAYFALRQLDCKEED